MTTPRPDDEELLARLGRIADLVDPVPDRVAEYARAAFGLRNLDAELAALTSYSLLDAAPVRADDDAVRLLSFGLDGLDLDLQLSDGPPRSLLGEVLLGDGSTEAGVVWVESSTGERSPEISLDPDGRFAVVSVPAGLIRLRLQVGGRVVLTSWIS